MTRTCFRATRSSARRAETSRACAPGVAARTRGRGQGLAACLAVAAARDAILRAADRGQGLAACLAVAAARDAILRAAG